MIARFALAVLLLALAPHARAGDGLDPSRWLHRKFGLAEIEPATLSDEINGQVRGEHTRVPFDGGHLDVVSGLHRVIYLWSRPDGRVGRQTLWEHRHWALRAQVAVTEEADGVVRVAIRVREAGLHVDFTTAWEEVFVPSTAKRGPLRLRFVTGINVVAASDDGPSTAGWERAVHVLSATPERPGGLRLVEVDGPLAWFRATGTFTWDELPGRVARWRRRQAIAFATEEQQLASQGEIPAPEYYEFNVRLLLLPGLVEPLNRALLDDCVALELPPN